MGAVAAAIALHAAVLVVRGDPSGGRVAAPAASALAVRIVHLPAEQSLPTTASPTAEAAASPPPPGAPEREDNARNRTRTPPVGAAGAESSVAKLPARASASLSPSTRAEAALAAAPDYAFGPRLDPGPRPLDDIDPDYPDPVNLRSGTVVLRLLIGDTGRVDDVAVVRADPPGVFEQAAIEAFAKARFAPGMAAGKAVKSQIRIEVQFMPINRGGRVSGRSY